MNIKEAIKELKNSKLCKAEWNEFVDQFESNRITDNKIDEVVELLQRGEEYKRILEHMGVISNNEQVNRIIRDTLLGG